MKSIDSTETYSYGTIKDLVSEKKIKYNNVVRRNKNY